MLQLRLRRSRTRFRPRWGRKTGKTEGKRCAIDQKETEEQLPKHDYMEALLIHVDMKPKILVFDTVNTGI